ncbi:hypothetical protein VKT23_009304 [Stygiomarasmius scandens]|uniref:ABM domain-containing protein n=1 Tax=Marasmiellus scandens TaxID=2682957 RepID=A0ABR1JHR1_9AGAR
MPDIFDVYVFGVKEKPDDFRNVLQTKVTDLKSLPTSSLANAFYGVSEKNPLEGYIIIERESASDDSDIVHFDQENNPSLQEHLKVHFESQELASKALEAPMVEFCILTLNPGFTDQSVSGHLDTITGQNTSAIIAATWGTTQRADRLMTAVGWQSKEAHAEVAKNLTPEFQNVIVELLGMATLKVCHVELSQH